MNEHRAIPRPEVERNQFYKVRALRQKTGATLLDCRKALVESRGDEGRAIEWLRSKMIMRG